MPHPVIYNTRCYFWQWLYFCKSRNWRVRLFQCGRTASEAIPVLCTFVFQQMHIFTTRSELCRFCFWHHLFFVCVWNISGTTEQICAKFTWKTCLVPRLDKFEGQSQRSRSPGTNTAFSALLVTCMQFMFGKTSLASSLISVTLRVTRLSTTINKIQQQWYKVDTGFFCNC